MDISNRGLNLIKEFEGLELEAYQDIVGIWTIGYGHTSMAGPPEVVPGMEITEDEATEILRRDLGQYENGVERAVRVHITQNMFDALVSLTYNIGVNGMQRSTFIRLLNEGDYEGCAEAMQMWNKAGGRVVAGLTRRRAAEAALFLEGYVPSEEPDDADIRGVEVEENSPRRDNLGGSRTVGGATTAGGAGAVAAGAAVLGDGDDESGEEAAGADTGGETTEPEETPAEETPAEETPAEGTETSTEQPAEDEVFVSKFEKDEAWNAIIIAAGVIAVIAAIYVILVRIDDWRNHRR